MTEDEMFGWHHQLSGHEFDQTPGDSEGQGSLACYGSWGHKESDTTEQLNKFILNREILMSPFSYPQSEFPDKYSYLKISNVFSVN